MPPKEHRQLLRRAQQKGIAAFLHGRALFLGDGTNATSIPLPPTFPAHYQLLTVVLIAVGIALGFLANDAVDVPATLTAAAAAQGAGSGAGAGVAGEKMNVVVTHCFVHAVTDCGGRRWFRSDPAKVKVEQSDGRIVIDGSATRHCSVALCFQNGTTTSPTPSPSSSASSSSAPATPAPTIDPTAANALTFTLDTAVLNLRQVTFAIQAAVAIETPGDSSDVTASKVYLGPGRFRDLHVNMSYGIVVAERLAADSAEITVGHGSVLLSTDFAAPFTVTGTVQDSNYCVTPQLTTFTPSPCTSIVNTTVGNSTVATAICPIFAQSTNGTAGADMSVHVSASALYISVEGADEVRIAGAGIADVPALNPKLLQALADTHVWQSQQALTYYLQVIDVLTPGFGAAFLHASRRITLELSADRLAFYTGFVMRPHYRRLPATLSHYGCPAGLARPTGTAPRRPQSNGDETAETLTSLLDTAGSGYTEAELRNLTEVFLPPATQLAVATSIYRTVDNVNALVAFDSPAHSDLSVTEELLGSTARVLSLHDRGTTVVESTLSMSTVTKVLLTVNVVAALLVLVAANGALVLYRAEILSSLLVISRRSAQRQMISKEALCSYQLFLSFNTFVTWIAFRVSMYTVWPPPSFSEFLGNYFRPFERGEDSFANGIAMVQLTALFERWMVLRYVAVPETNSEEINEAIEAMGGRRCIVEKNVVRGLRKRLSSVTGATFELTLSSLENYYIITRDPEDQLLLDDIFFRAVIDDSTLKREDLVRTLEEWCFEVSQVPVAFVANIEPVAYTPAGMLTEDYCSALVEDFEESCSSWPSYAEVIRATWGTAPDGHVEQAQRWAGYAVRRVMNAVVAVVVAFAPFLVAVLILAVADFERTRYSSTTSRNSIQELHATLSYWFAREQSLVTKAAVWGMQIFVVLFVLEPWLVLATFRSFGPSGARNIPRAALKIVRIVVSVTVALMYWLMCNALLFYAAIVLVWWILGAIIVPNYMLVYASAAVAFVFSVTSTHNNLATLRFEAQKKLEQRVLDEMLKLIRRTPASEAMQTVQDRIRGTGSSRVTAGMLMDATSDDPLVVQKGVQELAMALNVPDAIVLLLLGVVQRRGEAISIGVTSAMEAMKTPPQLTPLATQLVCIAVGAPANPRAIADAFLALLPGEVRPHARRYDEVAIAFVGMMMKREVDPATVQEFVVATCISELSRVSTVPPALLRHMYTVALRISEDDPMGALSMATDVAEELLDRIPADPPEFLLLAKAGIEALRMACHRPHTLGQAVKMLVQQTPLLRNTPVIKVTTPFIMPLLTSSNVEATFASDLMQTALRLVRQRHATTRDQWNTLRRLFAALAGDPESLDNFDTVGTLETLREARDIFEADLAAYLEAESGTLVCPQGHDLAAMDASDEWYCDWCAFKGHQHREVRSDVTGLACPKCGFDICTLCSDNRVALLKTEQCRREHPIVVRDAARFQCSVCGLEKGWTPHARVCFDPSCGFEVCGECVFLSSAHEYNNIKCDFALHVTPTARPGCRACGGATPLQETDPRATEGAGHYWHRCTVCKLTICLGCWGPNGEYAERPARQFCEAGHQTRCRDPPTPECAECHERLGGNPADYTAATRCRKCRWDICAECSADWTSPKLNAPLCREGHILKIQQRKFKCCLCDERVKAAQEGEELCGYRCTKCHTSQCKACTQDLTPLERLERACVPPAGEIIFCNMGHALTRSTRPWRCSQCRREQTNDTEQAHYCPCCKWCICDSCAEDWTPTLKPASQFCREGHLMTEAPFGETFFCRGCKKLCSVDDVERGADTASLSSSTATATPFVAYVCERCEFEEDEDIFVGVCLDCAPRWAPPRRECPANHKLGMDEHGAECSLCHGRCDFEHDVCVACDLHLCEPCFKAWRIYDGDDIPPPVPTKIGCYNTLLLATARHQPMALRPDAQYASKKRGTPRSKSVLAPWLAHQWLTIVAVLLLDDQVPDSSADYDEIERVTNVPRATLLLLTDTLRLCMYLARTLCPPLGTAHQQLCAELHKSGLCESQAMWDGIAQCLPGTIDPADIFTGAQITAELVAFIADSFCIEGLRVMTDAFAENLDDCEAPVPIASVRGMIDAAIEKAASKTTSDRTTALAKSVQEQRDEQVSAITGVLDRVEGHRRLKAARAKKRQAAGTGGAEDKKKGPEAVAAAQEGHSAIDMHPRRETVGPSSKKLVVEGVECDEGPSFDPTKQAATTEVEEFRSNTQLLSAASADDGERARRKAAAQARRDQERAMAEAADEEYDTFWAAAEAREERAKADMESGDRWAPVRQAVMSVFAVRAADATSKSSAAKDTTQRLQATRQAISGMVDGSLLTARDLLGRHVSDSELKARAKSLTPADLVQAFLSLGEVFINKRAAGLDLSSLARFYGVDASALHAMVDPGSLLNRVPDPAGALSFGLTCVGSRAAPWRTLQAAIDSGTFAAMLRSIGISDVDAAVRAARWFVGESNDHSALVDLMRFSAPKRRPQRAPGAHPGSSPTPVAEAPSLPASRPATAGAMEKKKVFDDDHDDHDEVEEVEEEEETKGSEERLGATGQVKSAVYEQPDEVDQFVEAAKRHLRPLRDAALYRVESRASKLEHRALRTKLSVQHGYNADVENHKVTFPEFREALCRPLPGVKERAPDVDPAVAFDAMEEAVFHWAKILKGRLYLNAVLAAREAEITAALEVATQVSNASLGADVVDGPTLGELGARVSVEFLAAAEATAPALFAIARSHTLPLRASKLQKHVHPRINAFVELARRLVEKHHELTDYSEIDQEDYTRGSFEVTDTENPYSYLTATREDKRKGAHYVAAFEDLCAFSVLEAAPSKRKVKGTVPPSVSAVIRMLYGVMHGVVEWYPAALPRPFWAMLTLLVMGTDTPRCALTALSDLFPLKTQELSLSLLLLEIGDPARFGSLLPLADFTGVKLSTLELARSVLFPNPWAQSRLYCLRSIAQGSALRLTPFAPFNTHEILTLGIMMEINHRDVFRAIKKASELSGVKDVITMLPKGAGEMAKLPTSAMLVERSLVTLVEFIEEEPYVNEVLEQDASLLIAAFYVLDGDFVGAGRRLEKFAQSRIERAAARLAVLLMRLLANDGAVNDTPAVVAAMVDVAEALPYLLRRFLGDDPTSEADAALRAMLDDVLPFVVDNVLRPMAAKEIPPEANLLDVGCPPPVPPEPEPLDAREVSRFITKLLLLLAARPMAASMPGSGTATPLHATARSTLWSGARTELAAATERFAPLIRAAVDLGLLAAEGTMTLERGVVKVLTLMYTVGEVTEMPADALKLIDRVRQFVVTNKRLLAPGEQGAKFFLKLLQAIIDGESEAALEMLSPDVQAKFTSIVQLCSGDLSALPDVLSNLGVMLPPAQQAHLATTVSALQRMREAMGRAKSSAINENNLAEVISAQIFAELDTDGDNEITFAEFQLAMDRLHLDLPEAEARVWFTEMDMEQRGVLVRDEFYHAVLQIRSRFVDEILCRLHLTKSLIYLAVAWFAVFLALVLAFIVLGAYGFSDGAIFTAVITGLMPAFAMVTAVLRDPGEVQRLVNRADEMAEQFFARLGRAYQSGLE